MFRPLFLVQAVACAVTGAAIVGLAADLAQTAYAAAHTAHTVVLAQF
ncbi:MAG TPA: hypothetical protein VHT05_15345 [Candidatus Elarobacter sp.]|jgi:hypothetical protein|nr:hypothetical protein [Candidatus Elarobacter sp.]